MATIIDHITGSIDGVELGVKDDNGVKIHIASLDGWWTPPASTGTVEQRAGEDGGWASPAYYGPRLVTMMVQFLGSDWPLISEALDRVMGAVPVRQFVPLIIDDHGVERMAMVRQDGEPLVARRRTWAELSLSLIASDSYVYGVDLVTASTGLPYTVGGLRLSTRLPFRIQATVESGILSVINGGNAPAKPVFTVTGPCPPFTLTLLSTGQTIQYFEAVPAGRFVVLDTSTRTALLDGVAPRYVAGSWFEYAPGQNDVQFFAATYDAAALLTSEHRDTSK